MNTINELRETFTDAEIVEHVRGRHNILGVLVGLHGISINWQSADPDAYGWQALSHSQIRCVLREMGLQSNHSPLPKDGPGWRE